MPGDQSTDVAPPRRRVSAVGSALRNPSLARVLFAFFVFNAAEWGTWIAILVYAYDRGGPGAAALVAVIQLIPCAILAPVAATLGDRIPRNRALAIGYLLQAITMGLTALALFASAPVPLVYAMASITAVSETLTRPVHLSALPGMARTPEELSAANALSSTIEGLAIFVGPAIMGVLIAASGPGLVFAVMAGAHGVGSTLVATSRVIDQRAEVVDEGGAWHPSEALQGLTELRYAPGAAFLVILIGAEWVVLGMLDLLCVILAFDVLRLGPSGPGIMASAGGVGALIGASATVLLIGRSRLRPAVTLGALLAGVSLAFVAVGDAAAIAFLLLAIGGAGRSLVDVSARTLLQRSVPDDVLSRVFGLQEGLSSLTLAVGSAIVPLLVSVLGATATFAVAGALMPTLLIVGWSRLHALDAGERPYPGAELELLRSMPIFRPLGPATLERLLMHLAPLDVETGAAIIRQGEPGDLFYAVEDGEFVVSVSGQAVARIGRGAFFGETALLRNAPRNATVTALTPGRLLTLPREEFLAAVTGSRTSVRAADRVIERHSGELPPQ
jgi:predicted MFS family arabinose efflux permease